MLSAAEPDESFFEALGDNVTAEGRIGLAGFCQEFYSGKGSFGPNLDCIG